MQRTIKYVEINHLGRTSTRWKAFASVRYNDGSLAGPIRPHYSPKMTGYLFEHAAAIVVDNNQRGPAVPWFS